MKTGCGEAPFAVRVVSHTRVAMSNKPKIPQPKCVNQVRDMFSTPWYATDLLVSCMGNIPKSTIVWEPAVGLGHIATRLNYWGFVVTGSDISSGVDFLTVPAPVNGGAIVTNPPFSLKREFYERCVWHGLPFALLIPGDWSMWVAKAVRDGCQLIVPTRRIDYITPSGKDGSNSHSQFHSVWLTLGLGFSEQVRVVELAKETKGNVGHGWKKQGVTTCWVAYYDDDWGPVGLRKYTGMFDSEASAREHFSGLDIITNTEAEFRIGWWSAGRPVCTRENFEEMKNGQMP